MQIQVLYLVLFSGSEDMVLMYQNCYMKGAILIMGFIDTLKERAKANVKTIVLPETEERELWQLQRKF